MLCKKFPQFRTGYINTSITILSTGNWPIAKPTLEIIKKVALKIGYYESGPHVYVVLASLPLDAYLKPM
jgi:hypothetical protein